MPKLQTNPQRRHRYEMIARAEGDQCIVCYVEKGVRRGPPAVRLEIDHADNNQANWSWGNLHLVCHQHNCVLRQLPPDEHISLLQSHSDQLERERERNNLPTWKTLLKERVPYEAGSPEMQANRSFEPRWVKYAHQCLQENGSAKKKEIISGGAAYAHCSIQTSTNYLTKYTSPISPFMETVDDDGDKIIVYREIRRQLRLKSENPSSPGTERNDTAKHDGHVGQENH
ncbi:MAG: hypothetical protein HY529_01835 [Chloroflexi bacterium]|nr:hypothetical protein [Chloroflexota bacterium]